MLRIEEGVIDSDFAGRRWDVTLTTPAAARADLAARRQGEQEAAAAAARKQVLADDAKVLDAIDAVLSTGEEAATKNKLLDRRVGFSPAKLNTILDRLCEGGAIEEVEFEQKRGKRAAVKTKGFRRPAGCSG